MLENQKHLFSLEPAISYLNGAYMSPQLKSVNQVGLDQLAKKNNPSQFSVDDFFDHKKELKKAFSTLIGAKDYNSIAIIPSVSYGVASVAQNIHLEAGDEIIVLEGQFPSHVYSWQHLATQKGGKMATIKAPPLQHGRAALWNEKILEAIHSKTKVVAIPQVHWADGTLIDLKAISKRTKEVGAKLIIDGTQSIGALPFSIADIQPDALICAGYKWLMGPYGMGVAYFHESFWDGEPIEHSWINRYKSEDFTNLTTYQPSYQPGAERFSVGESSNFIHVHMLTKGIAQTITWGTENIQEYCKSVIGDGIEKLSAKGCFVEEEKGRGNHLMGVYLHSEMDKQAIKNRLQAKGVFVSYRGESIRVSPHVFNTKEDFDQFVQCVY